METKAAFFLDRDGVIIEEVHYLSDPSQVRLLEGSAGAIARLNRLAIPVVVVTNQAGVAHGYFPEARIAEVHRRVDELLRAEGAHVDRYCYCPHHPSASREQYRVRCSCRKPQPGMLLAAAKQLSLDLSRSYLVGDKLSDIEAGVRAGCQAILVRTGYGANLLQSLGRLAPPGANVAADLAEAVESRLPLLHKSARAA